METRQKEAAELLTANEKQEANGNLNYVRQTQTEPPDGGFKAYAVMVGSFLTNGLLFGVINSYSVIYVELVKELKSANVTMPESRASLVGALAMGTTFLLSPVSGVLTGLMGLRLTAVLGASIAALGLLITSFVVNQINALYFTYGIMYGLGASFAYTPSLAVLGHYFKKRLGMANGIVTIGSSVFTVFMPEVMEKMITNYGLAWMFRLLALLTCGIALCGLLFTPISLTAKKSLRESKGLKALMKTIINLELWYNNKYKMWAISLPIALFGYFVPYVYIKNFIEVRFPKISNKNLPLQCIAVTSGIGRLSFGLLADRKGIDRVLLQQISFYIIGILTIVMPFVESFPLLVAISLGMGLFDGAFIALIGPIAFEFVGKAHAAQAIGCMLGLAAIPLSIGPPIAGHLYSLHKTFTLPFILAGISPLLGASIMFTIRLYKNTNPENVANTNGHAVPLRIEDDSKPDAVVGRK